MSEDELLRGPWVEISRYVDVETLDVAYEPGEILLMVVQEAAAAVGAQIRSTPEYTTDGSARLVLTYQQPVKPRP